MMQQVRMKINGEIYESRVAPDLPLTDFIRNTAGLTGTHIGCETQLCGACAVLADGVPVKSCAMTAAQAHGVEILTIEGAVRDGKLVALQESFWESMGCAAVFAPPA